MFLSLVRSPDPQDVASSVVRALVLYALAEFQAGYATTIKVSLDCAISDSRSGAKFSISDNGRGHAIARTIDGAPYLQFVYTHLDYPFKQAQEAPIQLQAIGISLINNLCRELTVTARKRDVTLQMAYKNGQLQREELLEVESPETGNTLIGTVSQHVHNSVVDLPGLTYWLQSILDTSPGLRLFFNEVELGESPTKSQGPASAAKS